MIKKLQYYISSSYNPYINLATEKYLLDTVDPDCVILYLWQNENTVVIGKNQNAWSECRIEELKAAGGKLARRLSGGGAVYHDLGNLNFTFLCSKEHYDLAKQMHVIQTACSLAGIETELSGRNDLLANGKKFSGNAFYNAQGKAYHHGTLLIQSNLADLERFLSPPKAKLEGKGIKSVQSRVINLCDLSPTLTCQEMQAHMCTAFAHVYGMTPTALVAPKDASITALAEEYSSWDYLYGKTLVFNASAEAQFPWGNARLLLDIQKGNIADAHLYTDAMDETLSAVVQAALKGRRLDTSSVCAALSAVLPQAMLADFMTLFAQIL